MRCVWIEAAGGERIPVNADQVRYLLPGRTGTRLIFGAFAGGFDEVVTSMPADQVAAALWPETSGPDPDPYAWR